MSIRISFCRISSKAAIAFLTSSKSLICRPSRLLYSDTNCVISSICCLYLSLMLWPNMSFHALISTRKASLNGSERKRESLRSIVRWSKQKLNQLLLGILKQSSPGTRAFCRPFVLIVRFGIGFCWNQRVIFRLSCNDRSDETTLVSALRHFKTNLTPNKNHKTVAHFGKFALTVFSRLNAGPRKNAGFK